MASDFHAAFATLKNMLATFTDRLNVKVDNAEEYMLVTRSASVFPQHKGEPMFFASAKMGKAYVSFHLMPIYMCPNIAKSMSPELKKRMQGKSCFNFKSTPDEKLIDELKQLAEKGMQEWAQKKWL